MASITANQVQKRLGLASTDIGDTYVMTYVNEVVSLLSDEIGRTLDYTNWTEGEANAIVNLVAMLG